MNWGHGVSGYSNHGCRCAVCRDAYRGYMRQHMQRWRAWWRRNHQCSGCGFQMDKRAKFKTCGKCRGRAQAGRAS